MMKNMTLTELINNHPETLTLMDRYGMDYGVGAMDTLEEAAMILGLSVKAIDLEFQMAA